jgi:hypothetical protein
MSYDELERLFGSGEPLERGTLMPLPSMPLLAPAPPKGERSVSEHVERGDVRQKATNERPPPPEPEVRELQIGDEIDLPGGGSAVVSWICPRGKRVAIGKGKNKLFLSASEAQRISGKAVAKALDKARKQANQEEGREPEPEPAVMPTTISLPPGLSLMPHQLENIEFLEKAQGRGLIADEPGLGKTISAILSMQAPAVVVCPSLVKVNWVRELNRWRPELTVVVVDGTSKPTVRRSRRDRPLEEVDASVIGAADVVVLNYDILYAHVDTLRERRNKTIVSDESHYLKNMDVRWDKSLKRFAVNKGPRWAKAFYELQVGVERLVLLTGTPILNRTKELFPLLHMLDPGTWGSGFKFYVRYCAGHYDFLGGRKVFKYDGRSNSDELHERINGTYMVRHTKESELANLPSKQRFSRAVSLSPKYEKEYHRARNEFLKWVAEKGPDAAARAMRAEGLNKLTALRAIAAMGKAEAVTAEILDFFVGTQRPLVVMGHHRAAIERIVSGIENANAEYESAASKGQTHDLPRPIRYGLLLGGVGEKQRQATVDAFQRGELDVVFQSIAIATGITLTRASDMYFLERVWRPADQIQAEDRIHRITQEQKVTITYFDAEGTVDGLLAGLLMDKTRTGAAIIDGMNLTEEEAAGLVLGDILRNVDPSGGSGRLTRNRGVADLGLASVRVEPVRLYGEDGERFDGYEYDDRGSMEYMAWAAEGMVETSWGDPI